MDLGIAHGNMVFDENVYHLAMSLSSVFQDDQIMHKRSKLQMFWGIFVQQLQS